MALQENSAARVYVQLGVTEHAGTRPRSASVPFAPETKGPKGRSQQRLGRTGRTRARGQSVSAARTLGAHSAHVPVPAPVPEISVSPEDSPFTRLPPELLFPIISHFASASRADALIASCLTRALRRHALSFLFGTRALRTAAGARAFITHADAHSVLTPVGMVVRRLWLTDTREWDAEGLVAQVVARCPNVSELALVRLNRLLSSPGCITPLGQTQSHRDIALTVTGYTAPAELAALLIPSTSDSSAVPVLDLPHRLSALTLLRGAPYSSARSPANNPVDPAAVGAGVGSTTDEPDPTAGLLPLFLARCLRLAHVALPRALLDAALGALDSGSAGSAAAAMNAQVDERVGKVLEGWLGAATGASSKILAGWRPQEESQPRALETVVLLVDPAGAASRPSSPAQLPVADAGEQSASKGKCTATLPTLMETGRVRVVAWPRNVDGARAVWLGDEGHEGQGGAWA